MDTPRQIEIYLSAPETVTHALKSFEGAVFSGFSLVVHKDAFPADDAWNQAVFCDDMQTIRKRTDTGFTKTKFVYIGNEGKCDTDAVFDVLPSDAGVERCKLVIAHLARFLSLYYDKWLNERFLQTMINSMPELVWFKSRMGAHMLVNDSFARTVGKTKEQIFGKGHYYIWDISAEEYEQGDFVCLESEEKVMAAGKTCVFEEPVLTKEGMKHFMTYKSPVYDIGGDIWGTVGIAHDLTDFSNMGIEMNYIYESMPTPIVVCDANLEASFVNSAFRAAVGIDSKNFNFNAWLRENFSDKIDFQAIGREDICISYDLHLDKNDRIMYYQLNINKINDYFGKTIGYYFFFRDVTREMEYKDKLLKIANTDELTGLYNRRFFMKYLSEISSETYSVIFIDLDNFKSINDTYGHTRGDEVLKDLAKDMKKVFRDAVCARFGGDEFAVLFDSKCRQEDIDALTSTLQNMYREKTGSMNLDLSLSMGSVINANKNEDMDRVLRICDEKMYKQKEKHHKHFRSNVRDGNRGAKG
ncbi:MAG: GGDEF domain-containing protein [Desulfovibrio sp.]|nr:GGDEF domain-containing protein [Desulfovibrio sp.]